MKKLTFSGHVSDEGALSFDGPRAVKEYLLSLAGAEVDVTIGKHYKKRTQQENRYYFGVVIPIVAGEIGEENKDLVHSWLQVAVGHKKKIGNHEVPLGTSELSTVEFEDYAAKARMFASKFLNVYIPLPNEGIRGFK